jgi:hypothetical protein
MSKQPNEAMVNLARKITSELISVLTDAEITDLCSKDPEVVADWLISTKATSDILRKYKKGETDIDIKEWVEWLSTVVDMAFRKDITDPVLIIERFKDKYFTDLEKENKIYHDFMTVPDIFSIQLIEAGHNLHCVRVIKEFMAEYTKYFRIVRNRYEQRFNCECGRCVPVSTKYFDDTRSLACCSECGRDSRTWKKISGRTVILVKRFKRKYWFGFREEQVIIGFYDSSHVQYDELRNVDPLNK